MAAVWARARAELRSGWRRGIGLALLIGVIAGAVIAAAAGARRTDSALDRFNRNQSAADALLLDDGELPFHAGEVADQITSQPFVAAFARARYTYVNGNEGILAGADGALGHVVSRPKVVHGRLPMASRADEVAVSLDAAKRHQLHLGTRFPLIDPSYPEAVRYIDAHPEAQLQLRVTAVVAIPGALPPYAPGAPTVIGTPALYRFLAEHEGVAAIQGHRPAEVSPDSILMRFKRGATDEPALRQKLRQLAGVKVIQFITPAVLDGGARRSIHLQAQGLWLLAALLALAGVLVLGQTLSRFIRIEAVDGARLRSLGMTGPQLFGVSMTRMAAVAVTAGVAAIVTALVLSPLTPVGLARTLEVSPGFYVDGKALALGALVVVAAVLLLSLGPAWRAARLAARVRDDVADRTSVVVDGLARAGMPATVVAGTRMALEPGRGRAAIPVRSTVLGTVIGIAALIAALTFGTSLTHLLDTPRLYGAAWQLRLTNYGAAAAAEDPDLTKYVPSVRTIPGVAAAGAALFAQTEVAGRDTGFVVVYGEVRPAVIAGRYPTGPDEVAVGANTVRRLHAHIGSWIAITGPTGQPIRTRVVGKTVLPADVDARLGEGLVLSSALFARNQAGADFGAVNQRGGPGADSLLLRFTPGANRRAIVAELQRDLGPRGAEGGVFDELAPAKPTDIVNFGGVERLPFALAAILAVLAVATLTHLLVSAVRRKRRDLAILKTLGFVRGQVRAAVLWQATTLATLALVIGVPVGIGFGRWLWGVFASEQGVVVDPRVPLVATVLVVPAAILLADLVAILPARAAGLTRPALVLRAE